MSEEGKRAAADIARQLQERDALYMALNNLVGVLTLTWDAEARRLHELQAAYRLLTDIESDECNP